MNIQRKIAVTGATALPESSAPDLLRRFVEVRRATEALAAPLTAEDQNLQSMPDASPAKWHRAHTTWFFETFVLEKQERYRPFHPAFSYLFNSYYDAVGARHARPQRGLLSRPSCDEVTAYRRYVDERMLEFLAQPLASDVAALVELGLNHEEQHQELMLTDILHAFAQNPLKPAYCEIKRAGNASVPSPEFETFEGGVIEIGHDGTGFAFDNEGPRHKSFLERFALATAPVTNREWLEFIGAGGYRDPKHWLSDGWQCASAHGWKAPLYWEERDGAWCAMTLSGLQPLDLDAPVTHVSLYEADAYARWRGKRLPTEAEWEHAAARHNPREGNFRECGFLRPIPGAGQKMFGDVWEWTGSAYAPYPGFRPTGGAVGEYNGKFMVNQMVLRGGSCVTPGGHVRATYRNFFYPHQRWQVSGVRLAQEVRRPAAKPSTRQENAFLKDVWQGLSEPQKRLHSKYFYDAEGAALFERICALPEYYLTRTECALLSDVAPQLAPLLPAGTALVEYGCGSCVKTRILLDRAPQIDGYIAIDICGEALAETAAMLASEYPLLRIREVIADFMQPFVLPQELRSKPLLGFFPGSTIGNLTSEEAGAFLRRARRTLGPEGKLLIGLDLVKDVDTMLAAYNDAQGVTAAFNKNVLAHINRDLGGNFDLDGFAHRALWNEERKRIEMHLVATSEQTVSVGGRIFHFKAGESLHTENCHKYEIESFAELAWETGWTLQQSWISSAPEFALALLT